MSKSKIVNSLILASFLFTLPERIARHTANYLTGSNTLQQIVRLLQGVALQDDAIDGEELVTCRTQSGVFSESQER